MLEQNKAIIDLSFIFNILKEQCPSDTLLAHVLHKEIIKKKEKKKFYGGRNYFLLKKGIFQFIIKFLR